MAEPLRRTMDYTSGRCKPAQTGFGFSVLVRLTADQVSCRAATACAGCVSSMPVVIVDREVE